MRISVKKESALKRCHGFLVCGEHEMGSLRKRLRSTLLQRPKTSLTQEALVAHVVWPDLPEGDRGVRYQKVVELAVGGRRLEQSEAGGGVGVGRVHRVQGETLAVPGMISVLTF